MSLLDATSLVLWICSVLMLLRVAGQVMVFLRAPSWLPPMGQWQSGLVPYWFLLSAQAVCTRPDVLDRHGRGPRLRLLGPTLAAVGPHRARVELLVCHGHGRPLRHPDGPAARPALVRRHDSHHLSRGAGDIPVDVRTLPARAGVVSMTREFGGGGDGGNGLNTKERRRTVTNEENRLIPSAV